MSIFAGDHLDQDPVSGVQLPDNTDSLVRGGSWDLTKFTLYRWRRELFASASLFPGGFSSTAVAGVWQDVVRRRPPHLTPSVIEFYTKSTSPRSRRAFHLPESKKLERSVNNRGAGE